MQNKFKNLVELDFIATLKLLATAYEEISVIRMQRSKSSVLASREFLVELANVFADVKASYQEEILLMHKKDHHSTTDPKIIQQTFTTLAKNGKSVSVFLSSDGKLYGDIIKKIFHMFQFQLFLLKSKQTDTDIVIVGKVGKDLYDQQHFDKPYTYFDLADSNPSAETLQKINDFINNYETVNVFYGKFENVMTQNATVNSVSGEQAIKTQEQTVEKTKFFFEPSLVEIMRFFEEQISFSLFNQAIHENELSRFASRIRAMEEALGNIDKSELQLKRDSIKIKKHIQNKKQLETIAGISLWNSQ